MQPNQAPQDQDLILGKGKVYFDRFDASGNGQGEVLLGNVTEIALGLDVERAQKYSSMDKAAGLLKSVVTRQTPGIGIVGDEFNPYNLALAVMGEERDIEQTGQAITGEQLTSDGTVKAGRQYALAEEEISSVTVTQDPGGTPAVLVEDTDYELDTTRGLITFLNSSVTLDEAMVIEVDYTSGAVTLETIAGVTQGKIEGLLRFIGDPTSGPKYDLVVWKVNIAPDGELGLISDDYGNWSLAGEIMQQETAHPDEPFYRLTHRGHN